MGWSRHAMGSSGEAFYGPRRVASFSEWQLTPRGVYGAIDPDGDWTLTGDLDERDDFMTGRAEATGKLRVVLQSAAGVIEIAPTQVERVFYDESQFGLWGRGAPRRDGEEIT